MANSMLDVLYVEDDPTDAMLMQEILIDSSGRKHFNLTHVESLKDALGALSERPFDAALLDLNLQDVRGLDNVRALKEQDPDLPVVVLSGVDNDETALEAIDCGAQEYLIKGHGDGKMIRLAIYSSIKRKAVERRLFRQANYDELTGLPNRRLFQDLTERALEKAKRWERREIIMFIDLDKFKEINDQYGHDAGNAVLKEVAIRMAATLRESDVIARYGGDEFTVLLDDRSDDFWGGAARASNRLLYAFDTPILFDGHALEVGASIGIAIYPNNGEDYISVLKSADAAMYEVKSEGGNKFRFSGGDPEELLVKEEA